MASKQKFLMLSFSFSYALQLIYHQEYWNYTWIWFLYFGRELTLVSWMDYRWHAIASWTWDAQDETCGICRMAFDGCCPDCKLPGDDCPLIWGVCNHAFHLHCILKWVNSQTSQAHCPMCRREWQFKG
ncbi:ring finger, putative [Ricinus communis]|uniref:Anaphase-promoting complex subunit 11 n=1 Tax=Ricinus communis TaxID=3988 RepID=B9RFR6_RICCO|nr:ring finger, putative [Ricinus communis]